MRNIFKIGALALITLLGVASCEESDNLIDGVLEDVDQGAVLRTLEVLSASLNSSQPESMFSVRVEEQDSQNGGLMERVDLYVTMDDKTPDNGTTPAVKTLVKSFMPSEFETGEFGLPRATLSTTFAECAGALGLTFDDYAPGDIFVMNLELVLTDGRIFDSASASGSVTGGFYASPFRYNVPLVCSPAPGEYTINMVDSYGDGWQTTTGGGGAGIQINLVDVNGVESVIEFGMCSPYGGAAGSFLGGDNCTPNDGSSASTTITIPAGTDSAEWIFPGDFWGEIGIEILAPDGSVLYTADPGATGEGLIPVVFCAQ